MWLCNLVHKVFFLFVLFFFLSDSGIFANSFFDTLGCCSLILLFLCGHLVHKAVQCKVRQVVVRSSKKLVGNSVNCLKACMWYLKHGLFDLHMIIKFGSLNSIMEFMI